MRHWTVDQATVVKVSRAMRPISDDIWVEAAYGLLIDPVNTATYYTVYLAEDRAFRAYREAL